VVQEAISKSVTPDLSTVFAALNLQHFDGFLEEPVLKWNSRLRSSAGRFLPGARSRITKVALWILGGQDRERITRKPIIEIASYLQDETDGANHIRETMAHEMIHYWLWVRKKPYGHSEEFYQKMKRMGARRYNPVPKVRPPKYLYMCVSCQKEYPAYRKLGPLACASCCKVYAKGRYDEKYKLVMKTFDKG
jgi:predicted SprT family Zn-dependent metalloprotease